MISLIIASWNRVAEPERLLKSLDEQTYSDFEVILIDQNCDNRLDRALRQHSRLRIHHLHSERGVSKARNVGLRIAQGDIIGFPDDDCWYPQELLAGVKDWFESHPEFSVLFTATRDERGRLMAPKFPLGRGACTKISVLRCAVTFNAFARTHVVKAVGMFREDIGPGTSSPYQSGEDLDYLIRPVEYGFPTWYEPNFAVYHPELKSRRRLLRTTYPYALGVGHVLRLHNYSRWVIADSLLRSLCGAGVQLCKLDVEGAGLYVLRAKGLIRGYFGEHKSSTKSAEPQSGDAQ
jgi:glycosyltransferase involved in cell wall biosynthesis